MKTWPVNVGIPDECRDNVVNLFTSMLTRFGLVDSSLLIYHSLDIVEFLKFKKNKLVLLNV